MKNTVLIIVFTIFLLACMFPMEAGEQFSRDPYLVIVDSKGNVIEEYYNE